MEYFIECPDDTYSQRFTNSKVYFKGKTQYQDVFVFQNEDFGRILVLDGIVQASENDEFIYHEMLAHVPIFAHGNVKNVLVIGAGDGGILREIVKHKNIESITQVELDGEIIDVCKEHMPMLSNGAFEDERLKIVIGDGYKFVQETDQKFDLIINDSTDPIGPGEILFTEPFFKACQSCLTDGGIFVNQNGVVFSMLNDVKKTAKHLSKAFKDWYFFCVHIPVFVCGATAFAWGTDNIDLRKISQDELEKRHKASGIETKYYNAEIHKAVFAMPQNLKKSLGKSNE